MCEEVTESYERVYEMNNLTLLRRIDRKQQMSVAITNNIVK